MGRPAECAQLVRSGLTPSQIAAELGITVSSVTQYLYVAVGKGLLHLSEIVLTIPSKTRSWIDDIVRRLGTDYWYAVWQQPRVQARIEKEELMLYLWLRGAVVGDLYFFIADLEISLHTLIRLGLMKSYGSAKDAWWHEGVTDTVKQKCIEYAGGGPRSIEDLYLYTTFIHLKDIIDKRWSVLEPRLPENLARDKHRLIQALQDANEIRNKVMHPVRGLSLSDSEFHLIRQLRDDLSGKLWRLGVTSPSTAAAGRRAAIATCTPG